MRASTRQRPVAVCVALIAFFALGCGGGARNVAQSATAGDAVRVGSYDFAESRLLAHLYAQALKAAGVKTSLVLGVGSEEVLDPALMQHAVDVVPAYTGTALTFLSGGVTRKRSPAQTYAAVRAAFATRGVQVLQPASAEDRNGFVVTSLAAVAHGWTRISDLSRSAPSLVFGGPAECAERVLCLKGLESVYGLHFREFRPLVSQHVTAEALRTGEIDVGLLDTTSGQLASPELRLLVDDRHLEPSERVVPAVNSDALRRQDGPHIADTLNRLSAQLTTDDLVAMNRAVDIDGADPARVAGGWLREHGLA